VSSPQPYCRSRAKTSIHLADDTGQRHPAGCSSEFGVVGLDLGDTRRQLTETSAQVLHFQIALSEAGPQLRDLGSRAEGGVT
jgi:hypothetical protein